MPVKQSFEEAQGHPIWYPWAFVVFVLGCVGSFIAAIGTGDWRYLLLTVGCYLLIVAK